MSPSVNFRFIYVQKFSAVFRSEGQPLQCWVQHADKPSMCPSRGSGGRIHYPAGTQLHELPQESRWSKTKSECSCLVVYISLFYSLGGTADSAAPLRRTSPHQGRVRELNLSLSRLGAQAHWRRLATPHHCTPLENIGKPAFPPKTGLNSYCVSDLK